MIEGSTVIYNDSYISELERLKENIRAKLNVEIVPEVISRLEDEYNFISHKLESAIEFSEVVEELINVEIPRIAAVKTISGKVIPLRNLQVI